MFASRGYVVAAVNFHGSHRLRADFHQQHLAELGRLPYDDLMKGLDVVAALPYVDRTRMGAAGASYGGYMIYWMAGHTDRFKALVAHDGIFNPLSMTGTTEELWFPIWEFGGTPLTSRPARAMMEKWSPANYVAHWKTPMLVVHGQHDYRVDLSEGLQAFTALQAAGRARRSSCTSPTRATWSCKPAEPPALVGHGARLARPVPAPGSAELLPGGRLPMRSLFIRWLINTLALSSRSRSWTGCTTTRDRCSSCWWRPCSGWSTAPCGRF